MHKNNKGNIASPAIIHSEKNGGFHSFFKEQTAKVQFSHCRVSMVSTPFLISKEYVDNYSSIFKHD